MLIMESRKAAEPGRYANLPEVPTTPEEFLLKVEAALAAGGDTARVQGTTELVANGQSAPQWSIDAWFDLRGEASRSTVTKAPTSTLDIAANRIDLVEGEYLYRAYPSSDGPVESYWRAENPSCFIGEPDSVLTPLLCGFSPVSVPGTVVLEGEVDYGGRRLNSLLWRETTGATGAGETRLLVEPATYLPVAHVQTVVAVPNTERRTLYEVQFVSRRSLAPDFFAPAALGYESVSEQQLRVLDGPNLGVPVYWPGRTFTSAANQAQLSRVEERGPPPAERTGPYAPDIRVTLVYSSDSGTFRLDYWPPGAWEEHKRQLGQNFAWASCSDRVDISSGAGSAAILRGFDRTAPLATPSIGGSSEGLVPDTSPPVSPPIIQGPGQTPSQPGTCPTGPYDRFMAEVNFPQVTVTINAPYGIVMEPASHFGVYNSEAAVEELVRSLRLRRIGE